MVEVPYCIIKDIKELPPPDKLPENLNKLNILKDVDAREQFIKEYFHRGRHSNCNMIYLNQNLFSLDRQSVRESCNKFVLIRQRGHVLQTIQRDFLNDDENKYKDFSKICKKVWKAPYNYLVLDESKNSNVNGRLRINWDKRVL